MWVPWVPIRLGLACAGGGNCTSGESAFDWLLKGAWGRFAEIAAERNLEPSALCARVCKASCVWTVGRMWKSVWAPA
jgi:hypothetical protein